MAIARADVLHIARLARLRLSPGEVERMTEQLSGILDHVARLPEASLEGEQGLDRAGARSAPVRRDEPGPARSASPRAGRSAAVSAPPDDRESGTPSAPLREDNPGADPLERSPAQLAPAWEEGFFTVPRLVGLESAEPGEQAPRTSTGSTARPSTGATGAADSG